MTIRVGIFGGSFDPPHLGHKSFVEKVQKLKNFNQILIVPAKVSPFKIENSPYATDLERYQMVKDTFQDLSYCKIIDNELIREGISYMYLTIRELIKENPDMEFTLILRGADFATFPNWKNVNWIKDQVKVLFATDSEFPSEIKGEWLKIDCFPISSSLIRNALSRNSCIEGLVHPKVLDFIRVHNLYS